MLWVKFTRLPHTLRILEAQLRHNIKAPPWQTSGPSTHMCKHFLLLRFTLHHICIVGVWFPYFYTIVLRLLHASAGKVG